MAGVWQRGSQGSAIGQALRDEPLVLQRAAAGRYCAGGDGTTGEVPQAHPQAEAARFPVIQTPDTKAAIVSFLAALPDAGAADERLASTPGVVDLFDPMNLVNLHHRAPDPPPPGRRSRTVLFPQVMGYELRGQLVADRVAVRHIRATPPESWAREVSLLLSTAGPEAGFYSVGRWALRQTTAPQEFVFFETPARFVRLCLYSNHGGGEVGSLGNLVLGVQGGTAPLLPPAESPATSGS